MSNTAIIEADISMTVERATEIAAAWNSGNPELVASFFTEDGTYHASIGPERLGRSFHGPKEIAEGVRAFFTKFPGGTFENLKVTVSGNVGIYEWDFVSTDAIGKRTSVAGCDLLEFRGEFLVSKNAFRKINS